MSRMQVQIDSVIMGAALKGLRESAASGKWVVLVTHNRDVAVEVRRFLAGASPSTARFSGRTILLDNGGKVSVTSIADTVFVPNDEPFSVMFVGWGKAQGVDTTVWRQKAAEVLNSLG